MPGSISFALDPISFIPALPEQRVTI